MSFLIHFRIWLVIIIGVIFYGVFTQSPVGAIRGIQYEISELKSQVGSGSSEWISTKVDSTYKIVMTSEYVRAAMRDYIVSDAEVDHTRETVGEGISKSNNLMSKVVATSVILGYRFILRSLVFCLWAIPLSVFFVGVFFDSRANKLIRKFNFKLSNPILFNVGEHGIIALIGLLGVYLCIPSYISASMVPLWLGFASFSSFVMLSNLQISN